MKLDWRIYDWSEITTDILYSILALRSEVFVVEQDCVYQDIDGNDQKAKHVLGYDKGLLVAHSRLLKPGDYFNQHSFGRAVVKKSHRGLGLGDELVKRSIKELGAQTEIKISAQYHLVKLYQNHGFVSVGDTYLEDGIPHIAMFRNPSTSQVAL
ncbi:MAG: GNAT family N-acetyltransferase [Flavobacteriaceae bacterium]|nr:GNAT family N-acetyltransferase [Flavobacteriaceae bacterium]